MNLDDYLVNEFNINKNLLKICKKVEKNIQNEFDDIDKIYEYNQLKILKSMQKNKLSEVHFSYTTGYGYNDLGREVLENIYTDVFNAEASLVRPQIVSGTHALSIALFGNLKYGDELISPVGTPYDTLMSVIGIRKTKGSLIENGIVYNQVDLTNSNKFDFEKIKSKITSRTKMAIIQRSKGYSMRSSLTIDDIKQLINFIKNIKSDIICMVDNCYGEFVDIFEPTDVGADLVVGSLIKNPGGGIAPTGGYIVGKREYVENASFRLTSPGLGKEVGPTLGTTQSFIQGLFLSPQAVKNSLKGAIFASKLFEDLGFRVMPKYDEKRSDIVQAILMKNSENILSFCRGIQISGPVNSFVIPYSWDMPGYDCKVIMAGGSFIEGSSIELSADAPMKDPFVVYLQGGLTWAHSKNGIIIAVNNMIKNGCIRV